MIVKIAIFLTIINLLMIASQVREKIRGVRVGNISKRLMVDVTVCVNRRLISFKAADRLLNEIRAALEGADLDRLEEIEDALHGKTEKVERGGEKK